MEIFKNKSKECTLFLKKLEERAKAASPEIVGAVTEIIENVRKNGDRAVCEYTEKFDKVRLCEKSLEMSRENLVSAAKRVPEKLYKTMQRAAKNIFEFHEKQKRTSFIDAENEGKLVGQRIRALERAGIYVPGGSAAYPSSVLMNCIPAKVAGVSEIIMTTPLRNGEIPPAVAAAALISGVDRVFTVGGAQAIAALAYGTESIPRVDIIAGPGNIFVATAKRLVYGACSIDMIAGPSEVLVIADKNANARFIAADLLSQAEHDAIASSILICDSELLAKKVKEETEYQLEKLSRNEIARSSINDFGAIIICENLDEAVSLANEIAPEHLELLVENPILVFPKIKNAGSVFLGEYSPEPLGDYFAGPNHVLPTNGTARFSSPLSVDNFIKKMGFMCFDKNALCDYKDDIIDFALSEGLSAHANSIRVRFE